MATRPGFSDEPVTFSPCKVIHVVVNSAQAPPGADRLLREALARVTAASGLVFTVEGKTTEPPTKGRGPRDEARYGDRWSPVLVAWTDPSLVPELKGNIAGIGGPVPGTPSISSSQRWVSGIVYLDGPAMSSILRRSSRGWAQARAIVQHELAHLVGLTHVESRAELDARQERLRDARLRPGRPGRSASARLWRLLTRLQASSSRGSSRTGSDHGSSADSRSM